MRLRQFGARLLPYRKIHVVQEFVDPLHISTKIIVAPPPPAPNKFQPAILHNPHHTACTHSTLINSPLLLWCCLPGRSGMQDCKPSHQSFLHNQLDEGIHFYLLVRPLDLIPLTSLAASHYLLPSYLLSSCRERGF